MTVATDLMQALDVKDCNPGINPRQIEISELFKVTRVRYPSQLVRFSLVRYSQLVRYSSQLPDDVRERERRGCVKHEGDCGIRLLPYFGNRCKFKKVFELKNNRSRFLSCKN